MSLPSSADVICPRCSHQVAATVWSSVNVSVDPQLKRKVLSGDLFTVTCHNCGSSTRIEYPCLYHDTGLHLAIWLVGRDEIDASMQAALRNFRKGVPQWYTLRLARTWSELAETVALTDAGLNDMAVQFLKLQVAEETGNPGPWFVATAGLGLEPKTLTLTAPQNRSVSVELLDGYRRLVQLLERAQGHAGWILANMDGAAALVTSVLDVQHDG